MKIIQGQNLIAIEANAAWLHESGFLNFSTGQTFRVFHDMPEDSKRQQITFVACGSGPDTDCSCIPSAPPNATCLFVVLPDSTTFQKAFPECYAKTPLHLAILIRATTWPLDLDAAELLGWETND